MILKAPGDVNRCQTRRPGAMLGARRIPITELNEHLVCILCKGYFIDATTIIECLHSFCRSCIVKYLETSKYCPVCDVQVHKTKPLLNVRPDKTLQDIVYKLVPKLFQNEMHRRRQYYAEHPDCKPSGLEQRGEASYQHLLSPDETICVSFNYHGGTCTPRYLRCQAAVSISHLQKLIRAKYDLTDNHRVDVLHNQDCLNSYLTLIDVAYIYLWKRKGPLELTYRIYENTSKHPKKGELAKENVSECSPVTEINDNNNTTAVVNNNDWKEVQLRISENGEMSVTGFDLLDSVEFSLPPATTEPVDAPTTTVSATPATSEAPSTTQAPSTLAAPLTGTAPSTPEATCNPAATSAPVTLSTPAAPSPSASCTPAALATPSTPSTQSITETPPVPALSLPEKNEEETKESKPDQTKDDKICDQKTPVTTTEVAVTTSSSTIVTPATSASTSITSTTLTTLPPESTKRKSDEAVEGEPQLKQLKPSVPTGATTTTTTVPNHLVGVQNLSNNHPLKKHSQALNKLQPESVKWSKPSTPGPPPYVPKAPPVLNVPKVQPSTSAPSPPHISTTQTSMMCHNNKSPLKTKTSSPVGYKTLRDPPKTWNPQISRTNIPKGADPKNVRPAKFFKVRNNYPRYLGNPASGVKPMYPVHVSPEKDKKPEIKKHSIVKIDPKTLKPVSERAAENSSLCIQSDIKINTSSVPIFNPLKLQSSPKNDRKSPQSPKKSASPRDKLNLSYTPPNPYIPNLAPTISPNQFMYPSTPPGFGSYDPRFVYHYLYGQRLPFNPALPPNLNLKNYDLPKALPEVSKPKTPAPTNNKASLPPVAAAKPPKLEKSLQTALEKLTQNKIKEIELRQNAVVEEKSKPPE